MMKTDISIFSIIPLFNTYDINEEEEKCEKKKMILSHPIEEK